MWNTGRWGNRPLGSNALSFVVLLACSLGVAGVGRGTPVATAAGDVGVWKVCPPGWNLVAGPDGSRLALHGEPLLLLDGDQETFAQSDSNAAQAGQGYWVYYPQGAMLLLVGTPLDVSTVHIDAGHWATIGNSGTQPAAVRGADIALTYEPNGGFSRVSVVPPGEAAFVFSAADTDVFLDPFSVAVPGVGLPGGAASPPSLPGGPAAGGSPTDELNYLIALGPVLSDVEARLGDFADGLSVADPSRPSDPIWSSLRGDADAMARDLANVQRLSAPPRYGGVQSELVSALQDLTDGMRNTTEGLLAGQPQRVSLGASELSSGAQKLDIARALLPM